MKYVDLLIRDNDLALDAQGAPLPIADRASIAQDIVHMIRESGLLVELVAERNAERVELNLRRLEIKVENDRRIVPGTAKLTRVSNNEFYLVATTVDYGHLEFYL